MTTSVPTSNLVETNSTSSTAPSTSKLVIMDECGFFRIHGCKYCLDMTSASFRSFPSMRFPRYNDMSAYDGACKVADTCGALSNKSLVSGYKTPSFPAIKKIPPTSFQLLLLYILFNVKEPLVQPATRMPDHESRLRSDGLALAPLAGRCSGGRGPMGPPELIGSCGGGSPFREPGGLP